MLEMQENLQKQTAHAHKLQKLLCNSRKTKKAMIQNKEKQGKKQTKTKLKKSLKTNNSLHTASDAKISIKEFPKIASTNLLIGGRGLKRTPTYHQTNVKVIARIRPLNNLETV